MSEIKTKIQENIKQAMKAQAKERLMVLRMISAAIKQQEVDTRTELTDQNVIAVLVNMQKRCKDSIEQYQAALREDLVAKELAELAIISEFLPVQLSKEEIIAEIEQVLLDTKASSIKDMAIVMQHLRKNLLGKADFEEIGKMVKQILINK